MKSMALTGIRRFGALERPVPEIRKDTEVLIRMLQMGVCGSDLHLFRTGEIGGLKIDFPFVIGHEGSGVVEETGEAVTRVKKGDVAAIEPAMSCGTCDQCLAGRPHTCRNMKFLGNPGQSEGLLSEYIIMPENSCYPLPEGMDPRLGCFAEPLSIGIYSVDLAGDISGKNAAILGSGPIGMSVLLYARMMGIGDVSVTDLIDDRLAMAVQGGADWTGNPDREDIPKLIRERVPEGLDLVFECCGKQEAIEDAISLLKPGGKIMIVGIPEFDNWLISAEQTRRKEIAIQNVRRQNDCLKKAIDLIAEGSIAPDFLITHHFALDRTSEAFELVSGYRDGAMKAMVEFPA